MCRSHVPGLAVGLWVVLLGLTGLLLGCDNQDPAPIAELAAPATVTALRSMVWAGESNPLPQLALNASLNLNPGGLVTTDVNGEAHLAIAGCQDIYLFRSSQLQTASCRRSEAISGSSSCAIAGTSVFNNQCSGEIVIQTPSAEIVLQGTWLSVTYLEEQALTLVIVLESTATVTAVLNQADGSTGSAVPVGTPQFYYTMPDPVREVAAIPAREARPLDELPALVAALGIEAWLEDVGRRARTDGVLPEEWPLEAAALPADGGPAVSVTARLPGADETTGALLATAVAYGVDWPAVGESLPPGRDGPIEGLVEGQAQDLRQVGYDLERALSLLGRAGFVGGEGGTLFVRVYYLDDGLAEPASVAGDSLADLPGVAVVEVVPLADGEVEKLAPTLPPGTLMLILESGGGR